MREKYQKVGGKIVFFLGIPAFSRIVWDKDVLHIVRTDAQDSQFKKTI